jgi:Fic family protein
MLPPDPEISMDAGLIDLVASAERALGRLDGATSALPGADLFVAMYVKREAALSSQIEGTQASLQDLLEYEADWIRADRPPDVEDVVNYVAAMNHGLKRLESLPLSLRLIREIHTRLLTGTRGGQQGLGDFRRVQNWIGAPGSSPATARYVPPPPDKLPALLDNFEVFLHESFPGPALVRIGITHPQFESIHPFLDGNGRVGRLLITFQLCEHGILKRPLLYLSHYFRRYRQEYYDRLQAIRDQGDWEGWLRFFLAGVASVGEEASRLAERIVQLHREDHRRVAEASGTAVASALALLDSLFGRPVLSVRGAAEATGLSFANANNLVARFCELGVLREITGRKRDRRFEYSAYLELFSEPEQ